MYVHEREGRERGTEGGRERRERGGGGGEMEILLSAVRTAKGPFVGVMILSEIHESPAGKNIY